ncbi:hypothetical protein [Bradyrhizobium sp. DOA1]|uniref:hypothetical protein n=1 Tax=Bradyrhizobium sp. DOA1 TaxID=1126616 RepID=UPI00077C1B12|nr:hypothetical protein [Bradyrhizobium sp. DOA1]KYH01803.1 hypothetical protein SE91_28020 [Bradyrhizobium sp. DOA1]
MSLRDAGELIASITCSEALGAHAARADHGHLVRRSYHTLSLLVFAVCLATFKSGFSLSVLVIQTVEIAIFVQFPGQMFGYSPAVRHTIWSPTLPQVAATLAATLVAYDTPDPADHRLVEERLLNAVLMLATAIAGPVLTERLSTGMLKDGVPPSASGRIPEAAIAVVAPAQDSIGRESLVRVNRRLVQSQCLIAILPNLHSGDEALF